MPRLIALLTLLLFSVSLRAVTTDDLLKNLDERIHDLPKNRGSLIKSYQNHSQSYIYDQALAIISFTKNNQQKKAQRLLKGLNSLQLKDGSLYFSYYLDGVSPYPLEGDKRIAGAISWVALAATHYQQQFKTNEYQKFNLGILKYLKNEMVSVTIHNVKTKAVRFAPHDIPSTPFKENDVIALEHNLDAYSAFLHYGRINNANDWIEDAALLKKFIVQLWDKKRAHFWSGASIQSSKVSQSELYLDNQTWSLLALDVDILKELSPEKALELNCEFFQTEHEGVKGFMDSRPTNRPSLHSFIWSEGTLGQVLDMKKMSSIKKEEILCNQLSADDYLHSVKKMIKADGGIAYATTTMNEDFTTSSSVAGTAWMVFAMNGINPFEVN